jgi:hypothetical protein
MRSDRNDGGHPWPPDSRELVLLLVVPKGLTHLARPAGDRGASRQAAGTASSDQESQPTGSSTKTPVQ